MAGCYIAPGRSFAHENNTINSPAHHALALHARCITRHTIRNTLHATRSTLYANIRTTFKPTDSEQIAQFEKKIRVF